MIKDFKNFSKLDKINSFLKEIYLIGYILMDENIDFFMLVDNLNYDKDCIFSFGNTGYPAVEKFIKDETVDSLSIFFSRINLEYVKSEFFNEYIDRLEEICKNYNFKFQSVESASDYWRGNIAIPKFLIDF